MSWPSDFARRNEWYIRLADEHCTRRQVQVLQARAANFSFKEIGAWLGVTRQAAHETHRRGEERILRAYEKEKAA